MNRNGFSGRRCMLSSSRVRCWFALVVCFVFASPALALPTIYTDLNAFNSAAGPITTDEFEDLTPQSSIGTGTFTRSSGVIFESSDPQAPWRTLSTQFVDPYRIFTNIVDDSIRVNFGPGKHSTALGFYIDGFAKGDLVIDVETNDSQVIGFMIPPVFDRFVGVVAPEGVVSITVRDKPGDGGIPNYAFDYVSFGQIVPEPASAVVLVAGGLLLVRRRRA